jgi:hypothetical protein
MLVRSVIGSCASTTHRPANLTKDDQSLFAKEIKSRGGLDKNLSQCGSVFSAVGAVEG